MIKKKSQLLLVSLSFICTLTLLFYKNAQAAATTDPNPFIRNSISNVAPLSDAIGWRYKSINGILYKRQYNYSTNKWIGNWVKA